MSQLTLNGSERPSQHRSIQAEPLAEVKASSPTLRRGGSITKRDQLLVGLEPISWLRPQDMQCRGVSRDK